MKRNTFVILAVSAFGLILLSFAIMGFSRIVLPFHVARFLAAPTITLALVLVVVLFGYSVLVVTGVKSLETEE